MTVLRQTLCNHQQLSDCESKFLGFLRLANICSTQSFNIAYFYNLLIVCKVCMVIYCNGHVLQWSHIAMVIYCNGHILQWNIVCNGHILQWSYIAMEYSLQWSYIAMEWMSEWMKSLFILTSHKIKNYKNEKWKSYKADEVRLKILHKIRHCVKSIS